MINDRDGSLGSRYFLRDLQMKGHVLHCAYAHLKAQGCMITSLDYTSD